MPYQPFGITVYDKNFARKGWIGNPISCTFTPRFNAQGTGQILVAPDDPVLEHIIGVDGLIGARVVITYLGEHLMSGPVWGAQGSALDGKAVTLFIRDDWMLTDNLAFIVPAGNIKPTSLSDPAQAVLTGPVRAGTVDNQSGYMVWPSSLASREAAVKWLVDVNLRARLGLPVTVETNQGMGGPATGLPDVRMGILNEVITPILDAGGLGMRVRQPLGADHLLVEVWSPPAYPQKLSARAGVIQGGSWSLNPPEATRILVGGPGELAERAFWSVVDTDLESRFGLVLERMREATGGKLEWGDIDDDMRVAKYYLLRSDISAADKITFTNYLNDAAGKALLESTATSGLDVDLSDTETFHFGGPSGYHLGDRITITAQGIDFVDRITEVSLSLTSAGVFRVTPVVGERKDDPTRQLIRAVASLAASQRRTAFNR